MNVRRKEKKKKPQAERGDPRFELPLAALSSCIDIPPRVLCSQQEAGGRDELLLSTGTLRGCLPAWLAVLPGEPVHVPPFVSP